MHRIMVFCLLISVCRCAFGQPVGGVKEAEPALQLDLMLERTTFEIGEPIEVKIRLTNTGQKAVVTTKSSEITGRHDGYQFVVSTETGEPVQHTWNEYISLMHSLGTLETIPPQKSLLRTLLLNFHVPVLKPGHFSVQCIYRPYGMRNDAREIEVESQSVSFQIVATSSDASHRRIANLMQQLHEGGDAPRIARRLGFTGDRAAIAPLIDMLYQSEVQVAAVEALLYIDHESVKKALVAALRTRGPRERMMHLLLVTLKASPAEIIPILCKWLNDDNVDARYSALEGISLSQDYQEDPALLRMVRPRLKDSHYKVRIKAAAIIGSFYDQGEVLQALKPVLNDVAPVVRDQATIAVGWVATQSSLPDLRTEATAILLENLKKGGASAGQAAYYLGRTGDAKVFEELKKVLRTTDDLKLKQELERAVGTGTLQ